MLEQQPPLDILDNFNGRGAVPPPQYALEPLALYVSGLPPEAYRNVNLPNGKALSVDDLRRYMASEGGTLKRYRVPRRAALPLQVLAATAVTRKQ